MLPFVVSPPGLPTSCLFGLKKLAVLQTSLRAGRFHPYSNLYGVTALEIAAGQSQDPSRFQIKTLFYAAMPKPSWYDSPFLKQARARPISFLAIATMALFLPRV